MKPGAPEKPKPRDPIGGVFSRRPLAVLREDTDKWPLWGLKKLSAIGTGLAIGAAIGRMLWKWAG